MDLCYPQSLHPSMNLRGHKEKSPSDSPWLNEAINPYQEVSFSLTLDTCNTISYTET